LEQSNGQIVEQIIRPTGLVDPPITIRPAKNQIKQVIEEVLTRATKKERSLIITITKRMAEDITTHLSDPKNTNGQTIKVAYLHSDIDTLERTEILDKLRKGEFDVLVGINLLREGIDLPEVTLVAILDAGNQGFLRSKQALIQIMGRAARNVNGEVILYTDNLSDAILGAREEVLRRREIQLKYNKKHGITPQTIKRAFRTRIIERPADPKDMARKTQLSIDPSQLTPADLKKYIKDQRRRMRELALEMKFEEAIALRDEIRKLETK
jgi:excinuclease ABC subunit B